MFLQLLLGKAILALDSRPSSHNASTREMRSGSAHIISLLTSVLSDSGTLPEYLPLQERAQASQEAEAGQGAGPLGPSGDLVNALSNLIL